MTVIEAPYNSALYTTMRDASLAMSVLTHGHAPSEDDRHNLLLAARFLDGDTDLGSTAKYSDPEERQSRLVHDTAEALDFPPSATTENAVNLLGRVSLTFGELSTGSTPSDPDDIKLAVVFANSMRLSAFRKRSGDIWRS